MQTFSSPSFHVSVSIFYLSLSFKTIYGSLTWATVVLWCKKILTQQKGLTTVLKSSLLHGLINFVSVAVLFQNVSVCNPPLGPAQICYINILAKGLWYNMFREQKLGCWQPPTVDVLGKASWQPYTANSLLESFPCEFKSTQFECSNETIKYILGKRTLVGVKTLILYKSKIQQLILKLTLS